MYVNVCMRNGNLKNIGVFVCNATMCLLGAWWKGWGGKWRRFFGRLFRSCMYKYPWKATFREPANQLTNQSHTHTQYQTFHIPHFPPHFLYFLAYKQQQLALIPYQRVICPVLQANGKYYKLHLLVLHYLCCLKCMFSQKKNPHNILLIKSFNLVAESSNLVFTWAH